MGQRRRPLSRVQVQRPVRDQNSRCAWDIDKVDSCLPKQIPFVGGKKLKIRLGPNALINDIFAQYFTDDIF